MRSNSNSKPHFLDLPEAALQDWRLQPQTVLLVESLSSDQENSLKACAAHAQRGEAAHAAYQSGWAACAEQIARAITDKREERKSTVTTTAEVR